jgi:hypothetical protein
MLIDIGDLWLSSCLRCPRAHEDAPGARTACVVPASNDCDLRHGPGSTHQHHVCQWQEDVNCMEHSSMPILWHQSKTLPKPSGVDRFTTMPWHQAGPSLMTPSKAGRTCLMNGLISHGSRFPQGPQWLYPPVPPHHHDARHNIGQAGSMSLSGEHCLLSAARFCCQQLACAMIAGCGGCGGHQAGIGTSYNSVTCECVPAARDKTHCHVVQGGRTVIRPLGKPGLTTFRALPPHSHLTRARPGWSVRHMRTMCESAHGDSTPLPGLLPNWSGDEEPGNRDARHNRTDASEHGVEV